MTWSEQGAKCSRLLPLFALMGLAVGLLGCQEARPKRPNLLLISVDTLRADALACYGGQPDVGEAICSLAGGGTRFEWAISSAPSTGPAIASLLTSLYPTEHGVTQFAKTKLRDDLLTVAEVLSDADYSTAAFVSNPVLAPGRNLGQGFSVYDAHRTRREANRRALERDAETTTSAALAWAKEAPEPWFIWVHYQDPHGPYHPPGSAPIHDADTGRRLEVLSDHTGRGGIPAYQALPGVHTIEAYQERYRAEIRYLDRSVAHLTSELDALGSPPAIVLTADHGEALGEDGYWFAHGHSLGLDQLRVPLLWRPAGENDSSEAAPALHSEPVSTLDVAPTLLAAAGLAIPENFRGRALCGECSGNATPASGVRALYAEHRLRSAIVLGNRYYARDSPELATPQRDRVTGGKLYALPPRTARLLAGASLPAYETAPNPGSAALESMLDKFLDGIGGSLPAVYLDAGELPDATQRALRELGYLE